MWLRIRSWFTPKPPIITIVIAIDGWTVKECAAFFHHNRAMERREQWMKLYGPGKVAMLSRQIIN
jgi:hypothetical protein